MSRVAHLAETIRSGHVSIWSSLVAKGAFLSALALVMVCPAVAQAGCPEESPTEAVGGACATDDTMQAAVLVTGGCMSDKDCGDQSICVRAADADEDDPGDCVLAPDGSDDYKVVKGPVEQPHETLQCAYSGRGDVSSPGGGAMIGLALLGLAGAAIVRRRRVRGFQSA